VSGVRIDVRSDMKRTVAEFSLERKKIRTATYRALNRAQDKVATETGREIRKEYKIKLGVIRSALKKRRASERSLMARLVIEGVRIGLIHFGARAVNPWNVMGRRHRPGGGVSVQIKVKGGRKLIRGAFITASTANNATGGGTAGMKQVWRRLNADRESLVVLRSISIPQAFANKAVLAALDEHARETFNKNLQQQLRYLTGG